MAIPEFIRQNVSLLSGLADQDIHEIAKSLDQVSFHKGQTVLFKGATVDGLHIVATGKVSVHVKSPKMGPVQVAELGPGEVFGETSILEMGIAGATIKSAEDGTLIYVLPQEAFRELVARNPELSARTHALIDERHAKSAHAVEVPK